MSKYFLQTIPNGFELVTTVLGLLGIILFLLSGHAKSRVKWSIIFLFLFAIFWRMLLCNSMAISPRYVSGLIIPFLLFALYSFQQCMHKKTKAMRWCMAIMMAVVFLVYIVKDLKRHKRDLNYYAIAEIIKKSNANGKEEEFLLTQREFRRITFLSRTDNIKSAPKTLFPYNNNFGKTYFPLVIDVDFDDSIIPDDNKKLICSFIRSKNTKKRINLFCSEPLIHLDVNPVLASIDTTKSILQNGTIEAIDSAQLSRKKIVDHVPDYGSFLEHDEFARTPQNAFFQVPSGTEGQPRLGIESVNPIDGKGSVSIQLSDGVAYLTFGQTFRGGQYSYSFLVQGERGTVIQPVYKFFDETWHDNPICLFTIPDSRVFRISCSFDFEELKHTDCFRVGVKVQNGKTLLDDFLLNRKDLN